ncbi:MAG: GAF domain-containing protein [Bacillaceae bacterium]|nr:GAF domain-containing protein [Bacillaceae bacterium]
MKSLDRFIHITREINANLNLDQILQHVVNAIAEEIARADLVGFFMKHPENPIYYGHTGNNKQIDIKQLVIDPREDRFARKIIESQKSVYIPNTSRDGRLDPAKMELMQIKSILGVPVIVENEVFGMVFVHDFGKPMNLTPEDITTIEGFVNMATVAITNARAFEKTGRLLKQQKLLLDVNRSLSQSLSVGQIMESAFKYLNMTLSACEIGVHLYDPGINRFQAFRIAQSSSISEEEWQNKHQELHEDPLFQEIIQTRKPVAIDDVDRDKRLNHEVCQFFGIKSLLALPMIAKGEVMGVIVLPSIDHPRTYSESEISLAQTIADVTATALSNALYAEQLDSLVKERTVELQEANLKLENLVKELKDLVRFKDDLIASLSHELRTPITSIMGSIDILKKEIVGTVNPQQRQLLDMADRATEKLLTRVNELLDFSKLEQGKIRLVPRKTDYRALVEETVELVMPLFKKKNQSVNVRMDIENPQICLDRQRIQQVLFNLLSNAHKFTPEAGHISIHVYRDQTSVITEVADTGSGISEQEQTNIFEKFYQAHYQKDGSGLGLAISKEFIELHNGEIWVTSQEGKGSRFSYSLPTEGGLTCV